MILLTQLVKPLFVFDAAPCSSVKCHILIAQVSLWLPGRSWCISVSVSPLPAGSRFPNACGAEGLGHALAAEIVSQHAGSAFARAAVLFSAVLFHFSLYHQ